MDALPVLVALLGAALLFYGFGKLKLFYRVFREYYTLWNVAVGARKNRRSIDIRKRLHVYVCKTALLDEVSVSQIYSFLVSMMESDVDISQFQMVLLSYKFVIVCRERTDGSLRGVMLMGIDHRENQGEKYTLFRLGLAFFQKYYQGGPLLYYVLAYHVLWQLLCHPLTPVYITGKAFSYKSYLTMAKNIDNFYPRYNIKTPPFEQKVIDDFALSIKSPDEVYDPRRCVLERTHTAMKEFVAPIVDRDLNNPHIKFFQETNPGWRQGHQLIIIGRVTWGDLLRMFFKAITKAQSSSKEEFGQRIVDKSRKYTRSMSFQCEAAKACVREMSLENHTWKVASNDINTNVLSSPEPLIDIFW